MQKQGYQCLREIPKEIYFRLKDGCVGRSLYTAQTYPYHNLDKRLVIRNKRGRKCSALYMTFDIESTTIDCDKPYAFMYVWQACLDGLVVVGRYWEEWFDFLNRVCVALDINSDCPLIIYVHFLSYEWQFIKDFFAWSDVFAREPRKIMKCQTNEGLQFRCSYYLTNMSLAKACEQYHVRHYKQTAISYDYHKIRYPWTKLTDDEWGYVYCDARGLWEIIQILLSDDDLLSIPLTSTGYVRRDVRKAMASNKANRRMFLRTRLNKTTYQLLRDARRGGNTHGYRGICGIILHMLDSWDISSSYPFQMMCQYFPMSAFAPYGILDSEKEMDELCGKECVICRMRLINIHVKSNVSVPYLPIERCTTHVKCVLFNGRILDAEEIEIAVTEIDREIILNQYDYDEIGYREIYFAKRGELPVEIKDCIRDYFEKKTNLKGIDDYAYAKSKNKLNAIFGMMLSAIIRDTYIYNVNDPDFNDNHGWSVEHLKIEEGLEDYYKKWSSFLPYQWGVYVTAHARKQLQCALDICELNACYCDTDSVKELGMPIGWINELNVYYRQMAEEHKAYVVNRDGEKVYMGVFEHDARYKRFITLGAKKYAFEKIDNYGDVHFGITIAGVNPEIGAKEMRIIENFKLDFVFREAGGTTAIYDDRKEPYTITIDGKSFTSGSSIAALESTYTLGAREDFLVHCQENLDV